MILLVMAAVLVFAVLLSAVSVSMIQRATVTETMTANVPFAPSPNIVHSSMNTDTTLNAGSTPAVSLTAPFQKALVAGAATIDLTSLTGTNGGPVNFNGLKVRVAFFKNPATNANAITIAGGASNAYLLLGTAWSMTLNPGDVAGPFKLLASPTVDATHKNIDLAGTGVQALDVLLVAG